MPVAQLVPHVVFVHQMQNYYCRTTLDTTVPRVSLLYLLEAVDATLLSFEATAHLGDLGRAKRNRVRVGMHMV
jgi:hypothetical protein